MHPLDTPFDNPESWEWVRFKDLADYSMEKTPLRKETEYWSNSTLPWVSIADLVADGTVSTASPIELLENPSINGRLSFSDL